MNYTAVLEKLKTFGITKWMPICECGNHAKNHAYISVENLAKVIVLLNIEPFTQDGAKKINHEILNRIK